MSITNKRPFVLIQLITMLAGSIILLYFAVAGTKVPDKFIEKSKLHKNIIIASKNGATLSDIKQLFLNSEKSNRPVLEGLNLLFSSRDFRKNQQFDAQKRGYYDSNIDLGTVLKNIKAEIFLKEKIDSELVTLISNKLKKHEQTNPFDILEPSQRVYFKLIQTKMGADYESIQDHMNNIVEEIDSKNILVNRYFSEATMSYKISIFALLIGLIALFPVIRSIWNWLKYTLKEME